MNVYKVNDILPEEELQILKDLIDNAKIKEPDPALGRLIIKPDPDTSSEEVNKYMRSLGNSKSDILLKCNNFVSVIYSSEYGEPNLPTHFDGDSTDLIINYQLDSNTSWDMALDTEVYAMEDNSALIFNPNESIHWRPHKTFKEGEYVRMVFFRFYNPAGRSDYSHLSFGEDHETFKEARELREKLRNQ